MNKVVLIIRDGWGDAKAGPHNAVTNAKTPNMTKYLLFYIRFHQFCRKMEFDRLCAD